MHRFVVNMSGQTGSELTRLDTMAKQNQVVYSDQCWQTPDRKRAAIFAFALVGLGLAFTYHQQKEASSGQDDTVPRSQADEG